MRIVVVTIRKLTPEEANRELVNAQESIKTNKIAVKPQKSLS